MKLIKMLAAVIILVLANKANAHDWKQIQSLKGTWRFSLGDDMERSKKDYNDSQWETIEVPSSWENEGFQGYNGFAWYRKKFNVYNDVKGKTVYLRLGRVDDVDEVYLNGNLIGASGSFPPKYETAYFAWREYYIPSNYLYYGRENVISLRVFDSELEGGIIEGEVALYEDRNTISLDYELTGEWKFRTGDDLSWKDRKDNERGWGRILVPGNWENQGYKGYDGYAWYLKTFKMPINLSKKKLVLYLGKIDDYDMVYFNGKLVGSTGKMNENTVRFERDESWEQIRGYFIPGDLIKPDGINTIVIRVYDGFRDGGIYLGPVGLIEQNKYAKYWRNYRTKEKRSFWDLFFN